MEFYRESKQLKAPEECELRRTHDCESCVIFCKLSLYCKEHDETDTECVDCAWDIARGMNEEVRGLHEMIVRASVKQFKAEARLKKQNE